MTSKPLGSARVDLFKAAIQQNQMTAADLKRPGSFVVTPGLDPNTVSVFIAEPTQGLNLPAIGPTQIFSHGLNIGQLQHNVHEEVFEHEELGRFRRLDLSLQGLSKFGSSVVGTSLELGLHDIHLDAGELFTRVVQQKKVWVGARSDKVVIQEEWLSLTDTQRKWVAQFNNGVDPGPRISKALYERVLANFKKRQEECIGLQSAALAVFGEAGVALGRPAQPAEAAANDEELDLTPWCAAFSNELEGLAEDAPEFWECILDNLPKEAPPNIKTAVRTQLAEVRRRARADQDAVFGVTVPTVEVQLPDRQAEATAYRAAQLKESYPGLGFSDGLLQEIAGKMTTALANSAKPAVVVVVGPRHSAADVLMEASVALTGARPIHVIGKELSDVGVALLGTQKDGRPTGAEGKLTSKALKESRGTRSHAVVVCDRLADLENVTTFLQDLKPLVEAGKASVSFRSGTGIPQPTTTSFANTVIMLRWDNSPESFEDFLEAASPEIKRLLKTSVVAPSVNPSLLPRFVERELNQALHALGRPAAQTVTLGPGVSSVIQELARKDDVPSVYSVVLPRLRDFVEGVVLDTPLEIDWSDELTEREKANLRQTPGESFSTLADVTLFRASSNVAEQHFEIRFSSDWQAVVAQARQVPDLQAQIAELQRRLLELTQVNEAKA